MFQGIRATLILKKSGSSKNQKPCKNSGLEKWRIGT
jgi:hypothetical protein